jgi:ABC-2 type transport system ATP-binding protein
MEIQMNVALQFSGVVKRFGRCCALDGLDLLVPAGIAMGLVGSNGAGKTTSFAVASGYERIDAGSIDLFGQGAFDPGRHAGRVAVMPQDATFPPYAKVRDLLSYFARLQGLPAGMIRNAVSQVLDWVHLQDRADAPIRTLSHGMRRRVVIAQAFLGEPELVMLDEPMSGLDPREVVNIRQLLKERPGHQTVIISSHNLHEIERICDQVAFIRKGRLVRQSDIDAVTGRHHVVSYHVAPEAGPDLDALGLLLPGVVLEMVFPGKLTCRFPASDQTLASINAVVLPHLVAKKIPVYEVKRGDELESVYIGDDTL